MKNSILYTSAIVLALAAFSCNREISDDALSAEMKAHQFRSGQVEGGRVYYVKSSKGLQKFPFHEINYAFRDIRDAHPEAADWQVVDQKQRALIAGFTDQGTPLSQELVAELESNTYLFLDRYLLKAPVDNRTSEAAAYYLRLLFKYAGEPSQWDLLAGSYALAAPKLANDEREAMYVYIRDQSEMVVSGQIDLSGFSDRGKENQLQSAAFALNLFKGTKK